MVGIDDISTRLNAYRVCVTATKMRMIHFSLTCIYAYVVCIKRMPRSGKCIHFDWRNVVLI